MKIATFQRLIKRIGLYPPFLGMGIRLRSHREDFTRFDVELVPRWYAKNLFGTHFGGSLYTMSDPFYVFIFALNLGADYIVWDQSAEIDFLKPAKGTILGVFEVSKDRIEAIREEVNTLGKNSYHFETKLVDESGDAVAAVRKKIYIRAKKTSGQREKGTS